MKLAGVFRDLEQLYDFQTISYGGHFVFQNEAKILQTGFHSHKHSLHLVKISLEMNEIFRFLNKT